MMKKLVAALLTAALLFLFSAALAERPAVVDRAGLFTQTQVEEITQVIQKIQKQYQIDGVVLTENLSIRSDRQLEDYADRFFEDNGYGMGPDRAGFLFMIDMGNRYMHISTAGVMIDYMTKHRVEESLDAGQSAMHAGQYGTGTVQLLNQVLTFLHEGREEGSFRFDRDTGERLSGLYNKLTSTELLLALVAGAIVVLITMRSVKSSYGLERNTYEFNRATQSSVHLTRDDERFLGEHTTRRRRQSSNGGGHSSGGGSHSRGSGVHVSSGGMSHGGGGRHF